MSEPVTMVIIDGVRYRQDEAPGVGSQPVEAGGLLPDSEPGWLSSFPAGRPSEEQLAWNNVHGGRDYPVSTGGAGRGGYPIIQ